MRAWAQWRPLAIMSPANTHTLSKTYVPLKQLQGWGPTPTPLGITGVFATSPQVITEAWYLKTEAPSVYSIGSVISKFAYK